MKKAFQLKTLLLSMAVAGAATMAIAPVSAQAGVSANVGLVTDYVFRGQLQSASTGTPALQGGLDYEADNGLFAGVWASTMDTEYEYDLYAGWGGTVKGFDLSAAYTNYSYTDKGTGGTSAFEEVNLSAGYGPVSVGLDVDVDPDLTDYIHYSISYDASAVAEGVSLTYGSIDTKKTATDPATSATYFDLGYATTIDKGVDFTVDLIQSGGSNDDTTYIVVGMSKSFDLM